MGSSGNHFCVQWSNHQKNLLAVMSELLQNNALTDVTLGVDDGRSVECHKMILAACSSYFQTLFTQYPCKHPFVVLAGVKYPEIMRIVEFMYKGEVNVAQDELDAILKLAEALQVKGLTEANGWSPDADLPPPSSNNNNNNGNNTTVRPSVTTKSSSKHRRKSSSPAHSTSRPYHAYEETPAQRTSQQQPMPSSQEWPLLSQSGVPLAATTTTTTTTHHHHDLPASADFSSSASPSLPNLYSSSRGDTSLPYEKIHPVSIAPRNRKRKMSREHVINRGTPILQTALKQRIASPAFPIAPSLYSSEHHNETRSETSTTAEVARDERDSNFDIPYRHPSTSPYATTEGSNGDDKNTQLYLPDDSKAGIASYSPVTGHHQDGGRRYKKYSRDDLTDAIEAVKEGMSANKAAVLFKVPSRTLYDKIKKLGFTNSKPRRSGGGSTSSACFPFGIGGNVDGSIYGNTIDNDNENSRFSTDSLANVLETSYRENRDENLERESIVKDRKTPSPVNRPLSQSSIQSQQETTNIEQSLVEQERPIVSDVSCFKKNEDENDNEAEDLSVSRKFVVTENISQSIAIKEET